MEELRVLTTSPIHGYGFRTSDFWKAIIEHRVHAIIVDGGSTDAGPSMLGLPFEMICAKESYVRDFEPMLEACHHYGVKIIISSAGGSGSDASVDYFVDIINEISQKKRYSFKLATIKTEVSKDSVLSKLRQNQVEPCGPAPELTEKSLNNTVKIVAQIGCEPYSKALSSHPDVDIIIGGRSYDPSPFAALAKHYNVGVTDNFGPAWHYGKILECGGICATPKARSIVAIVRRDHFDLIPLHESEKVSPTSAAAHTLYEKTRPDKLPGPGGLTLLHNAKYEQLQDGRSVRISGAIYENSPQYMLKLEGAEPVGFRTVFVGGIRDPILISQIDDFLHNTAEITKSYFPELQDGSAKIIWHVYGKNAVMGPLEPHNVPAHEIGIMGEVVAPNQSLANAIANNVRVGCLHNSYPGQLATGGNFAMPLHEQEAGSVFRFSVYHLIPCENPSDFPIQCVHVGVTQDKKAPVNPNFTPDITEQPAIVKKPDPQASLDKPTDSNKLRHLAKVVRSKNSGPFEVTCDVMFDSHELYLRAKHSNVLNRELISKLYQLPDEDIITCMFFDPALAWKMTIKRPMEQGSIGETDTFGTAQHAPLLDVMIPPSNPN